MGRHVRRTVGVEYHGRDRRPQSGLMLATRITLPHFFVSSAMSLAKSAGEPASAATPRLANRACNLGSAMVALTSLFSRSMTSAGVPFGAPMPYQPGKISLTAGTSGSACERVVVVTAKARSLASLIYPIDEIRGPK